MVILSVLFVCFATDSWSSFLFFYDQECARTSYRPPSWVSKPHSNAPPLMTWVKAYAPIWEPCNKVMQNKIMTRSEFESSISDDPIELLRAIKEHALNFDETLYSMTVISNSIRTLFTTVQKEHESVADYTLRF